MGRALHTHHNADITYTSGVCQPTVWAWFDNHIHSVSSRGAWWPYSAPAQARSPFNTTRIQRHEQSNSKQPYLVCCALLSSLAAIIGIAYNGLNPDFFHCYIQDMTLALPCNTWEARLNLHMYCLPLHLIQNSNRYAESPLSWNKLHVSTTWQKPSRTVVWLSGVLHLYRKQGRYTGMAPASKYHSTTVLRSVNHIVYMCALCGVVTSAATKCESILAGKWTLTEMLLLAQTWTTRSLSKHNRWEEKYNIL